MTDYGPNTPHVEALLAQVRAMTRRQAREKRRAWGAFSSARVSARLACWEVLSKAGRRPGYMHVAGVGSRDAADALVARDLITPDGPWNQAAYDLLTGPLRKAGITVHPDDPALEDDQ